MASFPTDAISEDFTILLCCIAVMHKSQMYLGHCFQQRLESTIPMKGKNFK